MKEECERVTNEVEEMEVIFEKVTKTFYFLKSH